MRAGFFFYEQEYARILELGNEPNVKFGHMKPVVRPKGCEERTYMRNTWPFLRNTMVHLLLHPAANWTVCWLPPTLCPAMSGCILWGWETACWYCEMICCGGAGGTDCPPAPCPCPVPPNGNPGNPPTWEIGNAGMLCTCRSYKCPFHVPSYGLYILNTTFLDIHHDSICHT